jgi:hypothetical protein
VAQIKCSIARRQDFAVAGGTLLTGLKLMIAQSNNVLIERWLPK